jgi:putative Mg2+ transporter-C (MgtC) family protein
MPDLDSHIRSLTAALGMPWEGLFRLLLAAITTGAVGIERELRGRQAGFRTNILVGVGAALAMLVSTSFAQRDWPHAMGINVTIDPARTAYGVMTGIGLLCAGVIVKEGGRVSGMTTAAGLWCATALGLACGQGLYLLAVGGAMLVVLVLWLLMYAETALPRIKYAQVTVRRRWAVDCIAMTIADLAKAGLSVTEVHFKRNGEDLSAVEIYLRVGFSSRQRFYELAEKIEVDPLVEIVAGRNL